MSSFSWLHLSDLHIGMGGQPMLWPMLKRAFYSDLQKMAPKTGPWDVVPFTGDLPRKAAQRNSTNSLLRSTSSRSYSRSWVAHLSVPIQRAVTAALRFLYRIFVE